MNELMKTEKPNYGVDEWRERLKFLADILFATSMSIMILNIDIPDISQFTETKELTKFMFKQLSGMATFFIAFITVAIYWMKHLEHFGMILKVNRTYIIYQLLFLASVLLIPFWNTYASQSPNNIAFKVFLSLNIILIGLFSYLSMNLASYKKDMLVKDFVCDEELNAMKFQILTEPLIALIAAGLAFLNPNYWDIAFILIPIIFFSRKKLKGEESNKISKK